MKDPKILLKHMLESIDSIEHYTLGKKFSDFKEDTILQDAVIRRLEIIGEAARAIPEGFKAKHKDLEWKKASAMRNILTHQ